MDEPLDGIAYELALVLARHVIARHGAKSIEFTLAAWAGNVLHGTFNVRETSPSIKRFPLKGRGEGAYAATLVEG